MAVWNRWRVPVLPAVILACVLASSAFAGTATFTGADMSPSDLLLNGGNTVQFGGVGIEYNGGFIQVGAGDAGGLNTTDTLGFQGVSIDGTTDLVVGNSDITITIVVEGVTMTTDGPDNRLGFYMNADPADTNADADQQWAVFRGDGSMIAVSGGSPGGAYAEVLTDADVETAYTFPVTIVFTRTGGMVNVSVTDTSKAVLANVDYTLATATAGQIFSFASGVTAGGSHMDISSIVMTGADVPDVNAPLVGVMVGGPSDLFIGEMQTYTAASSDMADTSFAFAITGGTGSATLSGATATTVDVTGTAEGTVILQATGNSSMASGTTTINVNTPEWYEVCTIDDAILGGYDTFFNDVTFPDRENFLTGDGARDRHQLALVAYNLCAENRVSPNPDPALVDADYQANITALSGYRTNLISLETFGESVLGHFIGSATPATPSTMEEGNAADAIAQAATDFAALDAADTCVALEGLGAPAIAAIQDALDALGINGGPAASGGVYGFALLPRSFGGARETLAAMFGTSAAMHGYFQFIYPGALGYSTSAAADLQAAFTTGGTFDSGDFATAVAAVTGCDAVLGATLDAIDTAYSDTVAFPVALPTYSSAPLFTMNVFDDPVKTIGEPFSGSGDYDADGTLNNVISAAVHNAGGNAFDFVEGASGDFGGFWLGNPALPLLGGLGAGLLAATLASFGAASVARRNRRK